MQRCHGLGCNLSDELLVCKNAGRMPCGQTADKMRVGQTGLRSDGTDGREMGVDKCALVSRGGDSWIDTEFAADEVVKEGLDDGRWELVGVFVGLSGVDGMGGRNVRGVETSWIDCWMGCEAGEGTLETGLAMGEVRGGSILGRVVRGNHRVQDEVGSWSWGWLEELCQVNCEQMGGKEWVMLRIVIVVRRLLRRRGAVCLFFHDSLL